MRRVWIGIREAAADRQDSLNDAFHSRFSQRRNRSRKGSATQWRLCAASANSGSRRVYSAKFAHGPTFAPFIPRELRRVRSEGQFSSPGSVVPLVHRLFSIFEQTGLSIQAYDGSRSDRDDLEYSSSTTLPPSTNAREISR